MKLTVELIPRSCSGSNIRTLIPKKYWDKLRKKSYKEAGHKCEICGGLGTEQGYRHDLECHEVWYYDVKKREQQLKGLVSLCPLCHQAKHIGRAKYIGKREEVIQHMKKVNNMTKRRIEEYLEGEFVKYAENSRIKWSLDLSLLLILCDIDKKLVITAEKQRLVENTQPPKSYRKKKKKVTTKKKVIKSVTGKIKKKPTKKTKAKRAPKRK